MAGQVDDMCEAMVQRKTIFLSVFSFLFPRPISWPCKIRPRNWNVRCAIKGDPRSGHSFPFLLIHKQVYEKSGSVRWNRKGLKSPRGFWRRGGWFALRSLALLAGSASKRCDKRCPRGTRSWRSHGGQTRCYRSMASWAAIELVNCMKKMCYVFKQGLEPEF